MTSCDAMEEYESIRFKGAAIHQAAADRIDMAVNAVIHGWRPRVSTIFCTGGNIVDSSSVRRDE